MTKHLIFVDNVKEVFSTVVCVNGSYWFLCVNFISWYTAKLFHFIIWISFQIDSLGFSSNIIIPFANRDSFISYFPITFPLVVFSCLITLANASNTILNNSRSCGHPCLVSDVSGGGRGFSPFSKTESLSKYFSPVCKRKNDTRGLCSRSSHTDGAGKACVPQQTHIVDLHLCLFLSKKEIRLSYF